MKCRKVITLALAAVFCMSLAFAGCAFAQDLKWPTFHMDNTRLGQNKNSIDIKNPANINLIWSFPRATSDKLDEDKYIVDDSDIRATLWRDDIKSDSSYGDGMHAAEVNSSSYKLNAEWQKPSELPGGLYQILVWLPADFTDSSDTTYHATSQANYVIYDDNGATTVTFDQSQGGGWQLLTDKTFSFKHTKSLIGKPYEVLLSNKTSDDTSDTDVAAENLIVVADAVKFVPVTGMEIYSSPASAEYTVDWKNLPDPDDTTKTYDYNDKALMAYTGTVELPFNNVDNSVTPPDTGGVYCINSVTPTNKALDIMKQNGDTDYGMYNAISQKLGTAEWQYPSAANSSGYYNWAPSEGPMEGGVFASPTIAKINGALVCIVTAADRQVYVFGADNSTHTASDNSIIDCTQTYGKLIWKGPGVTMGEDDSALEQGGWTVVGGTSGTAGGTRNDAFGAKYHYAKGKSSASAADWDFSSDITSAAPKSTGATGFSYAVYAWMPAYTVGDPARVTDATYTIKYRNVSDNEATSVVKVDQSSPSNQACWVKLGSSYFNVTDVSLSPSSSSTDDAVVADAVMIVPDFLGSFGYCGPVVDSADAATSLFAVNSTGRLMSFDLSTVNPGAYDSTSRTAPIATVNWVYPRVRTTANDTDVDQAWGDTACTPAYYNSPTIGGTVYVSCYDGTVHAINATDGTETWSYDSGKTEDEGGGFTSSPCLDVNVNNNNTSASKTLIVGSTDGVVYWLDVNGVGNTKTDRDSKLIYKYPQDETTTTALGAFRFSTATVADVGGHHRAWIGSTDGGIYSFCMDSGTIDRAYVVDSVKKGAGIWYREPSYGPIQGSVALDGEKTNSLTGKSGEVTMYVGDMNGSLKWANAEDGSSVWRYNSSSSTVEEAENSTDTSGSAITGWSTDGELFSSPNITSFDLGVSSEDKAKTISSYIYIGGTDGRIYAFSRYGGAWGGRWAGGYWPFSGSPNTNSQSEYALTDTDIQFDIFTPSFGKATKDFDPEPTNTDGTLKAPDSTWDDSTAIVSSAMKMPTDVASGDSETDVNTSLATAAKARRSASNSIFPNTATREAGESIYFEWGESPTFIAWNLAVPTAAVSSASSLTKPITSSNKSTVTLYMKNSSSGSSSGSQTYSGDVTYKAYTVLDSATKEALTYKTSDDKEYPVKRAYAVITTKIDQSGSNYRSPGPGWMSYAKITTTTKSTTSSKTTSVTKTETIPLPVLNSTLTPETQNITEDGTYDNGVVSYKEQPIGINNPIAIKDDSGSTNNWLAWPSTSDLNSEYIANRSNSDAHYNGNYAVTYKSDGTTTIATGANRKYPYINLGVVSDGTNSREASLGVMDRSAVGTRVLSGEARNDSSSTAKYDSIKYFRIQGLDLTWRTKTDSSIPVTVGGVSYGGRFPWEMGIGSVDYPDIYKRSESFHKLTDDADPSSASTTLPAVIPYLKPIVEKTTTDGSTTTVTKYTPEYDDTSDGKYATLLPDIVYSSVSVPKFQPANMYSVTNGIMDTTGRKGYRRTMYAYIDSNKNGAFDSGDNITTKASTLQEAYRKFTMIVQVPPNPKIEVENQTVDIGKAPHGLGVDFLSSDPYSPFNTSDSDVSKWFKTITVKNDGNVNLPNMRIGLSYYGQIYSSDANTAHLLSLTSDTGGSAVVSGTNLISSLDDTWLGNGLDSNYDSKGTALGFGYTLTKAKVGDPDPTVLTLPDTRKWDANYDNIQQNTYLNNWSNATGITFPTSDIKVGLKIPMSQPVGTYQVPFVFVYSDSNSATGHSGEYDVGTEPVATSSFQLKATVRENQLTGGYSSKTLPQIDVGQTDTSGNAILSGDATPAGFRDLTTGYTYLFWSSNRMDTSANSTNLASAPWFIKMARLGWDNTNGWQVATSNSTTFDNNRWWDTSSNILLNTWPSLLSSWSSNASVMKWSGGDKQSVRYFSPNIATKENVTSVSGADTWLTWAGTADVQNSDSSNKISQENRLFYVKLKTGTTNQTVVDTSKVLSIPHDAGMVKRSPSMSVYKTKDGTDHMWEFWQGGNKGQWSIYFANNDTADHPADKWSDDMVLRTPDCLMSVASPNAVHRGLFTNYSNGSPDYSNTKDYFDVIYSGIVKPNKTSDILLGRYLADDVNNDKSTFPNRKAQPLPRVFAEKLTRDPQYGYFTSQHLAWMRPSRQTYDNIYGLSKTSDVAPLLKDRHGRKLHMDMETDSSVSSLMSTIKDNFLYNLPYIYVKLPANYAGTGVADGTIVSATDGSVTGNGSSSDVAGSPIYPDIDDATGVYTYNYTDGSLAQKVFGKMLVDYSSGIVRFTNPINEEKSTEDNNIVYKAPEVYADYTPQTWRITTDPAADSSPRAFLETTRIDADTKSGIVYSNNTAASFIAPIDRLWVFWRKAGTGANTSSIYFKTYRLTALLSDYGLKPIKFDSNGKAVNLSLDLGGACVIDKTGTRLYFTDADEHYRSLVMSGDENLNKLTIPTVTYTDIDGNSQTQKLWDIHWMEELHEQSLFGSTADGNVNEGSIYAFADPANSILVDSTLQNSDPLSNSKIWVFWTSTRGGSSNLFWETISPSFLAK